MMSIVMVFCGIFSLLLFTFSRSSIVFEHYENFLSVHLIQEQIYFYQCCICVVWFYTLEGTQHQHCIHCIKNVRKGNELSGIGRNNPSAKGTYDMSWLSHNSIYQHNRYEEYWNENYVLRKIMVCKCFYRILELILLCSLSIWINHMISSAFTFNCT